ncbi:MAG: DUF4160 domain-containing protein [Oscillospiraceae bacterium]|nr:DUF4160 domain-containing protein [Oscillospiraceae bacterium]
MPEISRFFGIVITMYFRPTEHNPPHFHAKYGRHNAVIDIQTLAVIEGKLPARELLLVKMWAIKYQGQLLDIWNRQVFNKLPPLD